MTATYGGDSSFNASAPGSLTLTITKGNPTVKVFPEGTYVATQQNFVNVDVTGVPTATPGGTVQYFDEGAPL